MCSTSGYAIQDQGLLVCASVIEFAVYRLILCFIEAVIGGKTGISHFLQEHVTIRHYISFCIPKKQKACLNRCYVQLLNRSMCSNYKYCLLLTCNMDVCVYRSLCAGLGGLL